MNHPNFHRDTRQFRRAAAIRRALARAAGAAFVFALLVVISVFGIGYALSIATTMQPITAAEAAQ